MSLNVIGLFKDQSYAQAAVDDLMKAGFSRNEISVITSDDKGEFQRYAPSKTSGDIGKESRVAEDATKGAEYGGVTGGLVGLLAGLGALAIPGIGVVAGPLVGLLSGAAIGAAGGGVIGALVGMGVPENEAKAYEAGVRSGGTLIVVHTADSRAPLAEEIMERHHPSDVNQEAATDTRAVGTPLTGTATPPVAPKIPEERIAAEQRTSIPAEGQKLQVVREELAVGKKQVEKGGVRVRSYITEKPVSEQVTLHEERVNVERHAVDRPATPEDLNTFRETTMELRETAEVPVVQKEARVVEEVVLGKTAQERTETVTDTLRETHVDVEPIAEFRRDFDQRYATSGATFDQYSPAYSFGYRYASDPRFRGRDWNSVESQIQTEWERELPGTWSRYRDAVRTAWDRQTSNATADSRRSGAELI